MGRPAKSYKTASGRKTTAVTSPSQSVGENLEPKRKSRAGTPITAQAQLALTAPATQPSPRTPPSGWAFDDVDILEEGEPCPVAGAPTEIEPTATQALQAETGVPSGYTEIISAPTFALPDDPANMQGLPLNRDENPFYMKSCEGAHPYLPPKTVSFTRAPFPKVVISFKDLTANLHPDLVNTIKASPADYLAIIPFGAGKKFNEDHPLAGALYTEFIKTLGFDLQGLSITKATPASAPKSDFEAPWIYILEGGSKELRSFLLWQQTFAMWSKTAFSVVPFDTNVQSWVIANISGDAVCDDPKVKDQALGAIKKNLWHNQDFRRIASRCLMEMGNPASPVECAFRVTQSFDLHFMPNLSKDKAAPMWILMGKPITKEDSLHRHYLRTIREATYFLGMKKLEFNRRWLDCVWCKCHTHPAHQCPLPRMEDWLGPKPKREERLDIHPSTSKDARMHVDSGSYHGEHIYCGRGRSRGRGRSGRSRGRGVGGGRI